MVTQVVGMQIIRGDLLIEKDTGSHQGEDGRFHAHAGQAIVPANFQVDILSADHIVIADIVDQHHRHAIGKDPPDQALVGLPEKRRIVIVDAELYKNYIRVVLKQVPLHSGAPNWEVVPPMPALISCT